MTLERLLGFTRSLAARLVVAAVAWSLLILIIGGIALSNQYRDSVLHALDEDLQVVLDNLVAEAEVGRDGAIVLKEKPKDSRFQNAASGRYWQIAPLTQDARPAPQQQSDSLWDEASLPWPEGGPDMLVAQRGKTLVSNVEGPFDQPVRLAAMVVQLPGGKTPAGRLSSR